MRSVNFANGGDSGGDSTGVGPEEELRHFLDARLNDVYVLNPIPYSSDILPPFVVIDYDVRGD